VLPGGGGDDTLTFYWQEKVRWSSPKGRAYIIIGERSYIVERNEIALRRKSFFYHARGRGQTQYQGRNEGGWGGRVEFMTKEGACFFHTEGTPAIILAGGRPVYRQLKKGGGGGGWTAWLKQQGERKKRGNPPPCCVISRERRILIPWAGRKGGGS